VSRNSIKFLFSCLITLCVFLLGLYYGVSICIVTSASAMAVITLNIHHRGIRNIPVPNSIRLLTHFFSKILFIQSDKDSEPPTFINKTSTKDLNDLKLKLGVSAISKANYASCILKIIIKLFVL